MNVVNRSPAAVRIAFLSKSDETGGGASRIACQLRQLIPRHDECFGIDHWVGLRNPRPPLLGLHGKGFRWKAYRIARKLSRWVGLPDFLTLDRLRFSLARQHAYRLFHVHDISDAISPYTLKSLAKRAPVIWTFHDCSPFTGGCIQPMDCMAYKATRCDKCPQLRSWPLLTKIDRTTYMQAYKVALINGLVDAVICPSEWVAEQARAAGVDAPLLSIIPNAVDTRTFSPEDKMQLREELGLPKEAPILLIATMDFSDPYKGWKFARQALMRISRPLQVVLIGANRQGLELPSQHKYFIMDRTFERRRLAKYYAACDLLLYPSMADNCPLMLLESMACGTPAAAFDSGGIPEIITHELDGWLGARGDTDALVRGVDVAMGNEVIRLGWSRAAREKVLKKFNEESFLKAHLSLYETMLNKPRRHAT